MTRAAMRRTVDQERAAIPFGRLMGIKDLFALLEAERVPHPLAVRMLKGNGSVFATIGQLERDYRHDEESMATMPSAWQRKNASISARRAFPPCHIADVGLADIDAVFETLTMDARSNP
jgi:hypothetical protein